jgi:ribulose-5-phosphate 4-epimerase/fuculose-1-phosphate aldolase
MNQPRDLPLPAGVRREHCTPQEWALRVELAAAYRLAHHFGWSMVIFNHITARVPGAQEHFLINNFGLMYDEVTASNLLKLDLDGNVVGEYAGPARVNLAGYVIHSAIHGARADVQCVMHTHSPAGSAVSSIEPGLLHINQDSMQLTGQVAYHEFEGLAVDAGEKARLVADLGERKVLILRNHGLLTTGTSVGEAFMLMYLLEHACRTQVATLSMGQPLHGSDDMLGRIARLVPQQQYAITPSGLGGLPFQALMRMLDRSDPGYRD